MAFGTVFSLVIIAGTVESYVIQSGLKTDVVFVYLNHFLVQIEIPAVQVVFEHGHLVYLIPFVHMELYSDA